MAGSSGSAALPVIDVGPLLGGGPAAARAAVAEQIQVACRERGFFYVTGHGVPGGLLDELADASAEFFALPAAGKLEIAMERGGRAWRGYFPVGAELTSGRPDQKEGLYFGTELPGDDPRVMAGLPLHGASLFPRQVPRLRPLVLAYLDALASPGQAVLAGVAQSLGLDASYFAAGYTADPTTLFRIFHYPPSPRQAGSWGVGEHTDYELVTLLAQDDSGGLQIAAPEGWIDAPHRRLRRLRPPFCSSAAAARGRAAGGGGGGGGGGTGNPACSSARTTWPLCCGQGRQGDSLIHHSCLGAEVSHVLW
jgi:isopenicillin N synthase-like dioxygenase